jgi:hypothetical protein
MDNKVCNNMLKKNSLVFECAIGICIAYIVIVYDCR